MTEFNEQQELSLVNEALSKPKFGDPYDKPYITGLKLERDVIIGDLVLNSIDTDPTSSTYKTILICTDIDGWWDLPEPEVPDIPRGLDDGSYDVRGRWRARNFTIKGTILPPNKDMAPAARQKLLQAFDIVYSGAWLRVKESPMRSAYVRLVGAIDVVNTNARGKMEFTAQLRAGDPVKYGWNESSKTTLKSIVRDNVATIYVDSVVGLANSTSTKIFDVGAPFDGVHTISNVLTTSNTFTYPLVAPDQSTTTTGYVINSLSYLSTGHTIVDVPINSIGGTSNVAVTNYGTTNVAVTFSIEGPMAGPSYIRNITTGENMRIVKSLRPNTTSSNVTTYSRTATTTTLTTNIAHSFVVGDTITVANLSTSSANGQRVITGVSDTTVQYTDPAANVTSATLVNNQVTLIAPGHGIANLSDIYVYGLGIPYDGTYTISSTPNVNAITYTRTYANTLVTYEGYVIKQNTSPVADIADIRLTNSDTLEIDTYNKTILYRGLPDAARSALDANVDFIKLKPGVNRLQIEKQDGTPVSANVKYRSGWLG